MNLIFRNLTLLIILIFLVISSIIIHLHKESIWTNYKNEMENIINNEFTQTMHKVDICVSDAENIYNTIVKNGYNDTEAINLTLIYEISLPAASLDLYAKLMKTTQEKYLKMEYIPIGTDTPEPIYEYLSPYFKKQKVDETQLNKINLYIEQQNKIIKNYIEEVNRLQTFK